MLVIYCPSDHLAVSMSAGGGSMLMLIVTLMLLLCCIQWQWQFATVIVSYRVGVIAMLLPPIPPPPPPSSPSISDNHLHFCLQFAHIYILNFVSSIGFSSAFFFFWLLRHLLPNVPFPSPQRPDDLRRDGSGQGGNTEEDE